MERMLRLIYNAINNAMKEALLKVEIGLKQITLEIANLFN